MKLTLTTPDAALYDGEMEQVNLPSAGGEIGVRKGHAPMVVALLPGVVEIYIRQGDTPQHYAVTGGFAEVTASSVTILATGADAAASLQEEAVLEAQRRAHEARANAQTEEEFTDAAALLEKSLAQLKTIKRRKKWRQ